MDLGLALRGEISALKNVMSLRGRNRFATLCDSVSGWRHGPWCLVGRPPPVVRRSRVARRRLPGPTGREKFFDRVIINITLFYLTQELNLILILLLF